MRALVRVKREGGFVMVLIDEHDQISEEIRIDDVIVDDASGMFRLVSDGYHTFIEGIVTKENLDITWC